MVRFIIMSVLLAIPLSAQPKSTAELVLECGEYAQLARTGLPVGVDQYLIASCFAYIEAFLDLAVTGPKARKQCMPPELELGVLATQIADITDDDRRPSSAALALEAVLAEVLACQ